MVLKYHLVLMLAIANPLALELTSDSGHGNHYQGCTGPPASSQLFPHAKTKQAGSWKLLFFFQGSFICLKKLTDFPFLVR